MHCTYDFQISCTLVWYTVIKCSHLGYCAGYLRMLEVSLHKFSAQHSRSHLCEKFKQHSSPPAPQTYSDQHPQHLLPRSLHQPLVVSWMAACKKLKATQQRRAYRCLLSPACRRMWQKITCIINNKAQYVLPRHHDFRQAACRPSGLQIQPPSARVSDNLLQHSWMAPFWTGLLTAVTSSKA